MDLSAAAKVNRLEAEICTGQGRKVVATLRPDPTDLLSKVEFSVFKEIEPGVWADSGEGFSILSFFLDDFISLLTWASRAA